VWGVNILEDASHRIGLLQYNLSTEEDYQMNRPSKNKGSEGFVFKAAQIFELLLEVGDQNFNI
jgi:hypothetical protein